jgi:hypothetical protein
VEELNIILSKVLDKAQLDRYEEIMRFLRMPLPDRDAGDYRPYVRDNIECQNFLSEVKTQIRFFMSRKRSTLYKHESELKLQAKDEKLAQAERSAYCFSDPKYADMSEEVELYQLVHDRLDSVEWSLKSTLKAIGGK